VSGCDVITRSGGSVRYDVTLWLREFAGGFPGIPSASYDDVRKSMGVVSAETSGKDAENIEIKYTRSSVDDVDV